MKKNGLKSLLALLLTLCLLLGTVVALAEEPTVTVVKNENGNADVTVEAGAIEGELYISTGYNKAANTDYPVIQLGNKPLDIEGEMITESLNTYDNLAMHADSVDLKGSSGEETGIIVVPEWVPSGATIAVDIAGDVAVVPESATDITSGESSYHGIFVSTDEAEADSTLNISTGNITVDASVDDEAQASGIGARLRADEISTSISTGSINAAGGTGDDGAGKGMYVFTYGNDAAANVTVSGDVIATGYEATGIDAWSYGTINLSVTGDIDAEGKEYATGIVTTSDDTGTIDVVVDGNVTANGDYGVGVFADNPEEGITNIVVHGDVSGEGEKSSGLRIRTSENATTDILIEGTLSGSEVAIEAYYTETIEGSTGIDTYSPEAANIYVWQAVPNADSEIAQAVDTIWGGEEEHVVNAEVSAKLEQAIWYIVKVADAWKSKLTAAGTGTYTADGTTYDLAHQDDAVTLTLALAEDEVLDGIQYNDDQAAEYTANADGTYTVNMLRGGAMLLGLSTHWLGTHEHEQATREENVVAATCTAEGSYDLVTYCAVCNEVLSVEKKTIPAAGHFPGEAVRENEVAATCTTAGSYDEVIYCTACEAELSRTAQVVQALGHTEEVIPAVAPTCTATGLTEGKKCSVCGEILVEQEEVKANGHLYCPGQIVEGPSCCAASKRIYNCYYCDAAILQDVGEPDGKTHVWCKGEAIAPTCVSAGKQIYNCYYCDAAISEDVGAADPTSHTWCAVIVDGKAVNACYWCDATKAAE